MSGFLDSFNVPLSGAGGGFLSPESTYTDFDTRYIPDRFSFDSVDAALPNRVIDVASTQTSVFLVCADNSVHNLKIIDGRSELLLVFHQNKGDISYIRASPSNNFLFLKRNGFEVFNIMRDRFETISGFTGDFMGAVFVEDADGEKLIVISSEDATKLTLNLFCSQNGKRWRVEERADYYLNHPMIGLVNLEFVTREVSGTRQLSLYFTIKDANGVKAELLSTMEPRIDALLEAYNGRREEAFVIDGFDVSRCRNCAIYDDKSTHSTIVASYGQQPTTASEMKDTLFVRCISRKEEINFDHSSTVEDATDRVPLSILQSDWHFFVTCVDNIVVYNKIPYINSNVPHQLRRKHFACEEYPLPFRTPLNEDSKVFSVVFFESIFPRFFLINGVDIIEVTMHCEEEDNWEVYMHHQMFDSALSSLVSNDGVEEKKRIIHGTEAQHVYDEARQESGEVADRLYKRAAKLWAKSDVDFANVCLKLYKSKALSVYLKQLLSHDWYSEDTRQVALKMLGIEFQTQRIMETKSITKRAELLEELGSLVVTRPNQDGEDPFSHVIDRVFSTASEYGDMAVLLTIAEATNDYQKLIFIYLQIDKTHKTVRSPMTQEMIDILEHIESFDARTITESQAKSIARYMEAIFMTLHAEAIERGRAILDDIVAMCGNERLVAMKRRMRNFVELAIDCIILSNDKDLVYNFSPILCEHETNVALKQNVLQKTVDMWKRIDGLEPVKLLPALIQTELAEWSREDVDEQKEIEREGKADMRTKLLAYQYLQSTFEKLKLGGQLESITPSLCNIYGFLLIELEKDEAFLVFFDTTDSIEKTDLHYLLRVARRKRDSSAKFRILGHLYFKLKLYEDALSVLLTNEETELALNLLRDSDLDNSSKNRLNLLFAKNCFDQGHFDKVLEDLKQKLGSSADLDKLVVDLLPFIPPSTTLGTLKKNVIMSLTNSDSSMKQAQLNLNRLVETTKFLDELEQRFDALPVVMSTAAMCHSCGDPVWGTKFFTFPCGHAFHSDRCMMKYRKRLGVSNGVLDRAADTLSALQKLRSSGPKLEEELAVYGFNAEEESAPDFLERLIESQEQFLNETLGESCPVCGYIAIKSATNPYSINKMFTDTENSKYAKWDRS
ncbi:hypothetical protein PCE1_004442 [Barthelona sp. PCE]